MRDDFKKIVTNKFKVSIPKKYKIKKRNPYLMSKLFFFFFKRKIKKEFPGLPNYSPDIEGLKGHYLYEVKMGDHSLIFSTEMGDSKPEYMAEEIMYQTRYLPTLTDITINNYPGKMYGEYSTEHSRIDWCIKKNNCMIRFSFQGLGMPSQTTKDAVSNILNSLEYIEE